MYQIAVAPFLLYIGLFIFFIIFSVCILFPAFLLSVTKSSIPIVQWNLSDTLFVEFFGLTDKGFPLLFIVMMLTSVYISYRYPNWFVGLCNIGIFLFSVFLNQGINTASIAIANGFDTAQLLPNMTLFFTSPFAIYPILLFTALCVIFNFRNDNVSTESAHNEFTYGYNREAHYRESGFENDY